MNQFAISIMEAFDEFLRQNNIKLPNSIKEMVEDGVDPNENDVALYGTDYGNLMDTITSIIEEE